MGVKIIEEGDCVDRCLIMPFEEIVWILSGE